jgi:hypothetical protein
MDADDLSAKGNGGLRQMHNYVDLNYVDKISASANDDDGGYKKGSNKIPEGLTIEQLQQQRENDYQKISNQQRRNV